MNASLPFVARYLRNLAIVLTILGLSGAFLGCGPSAVPVVASDATAFSAMLGAEMTADALRPAHWMRDYVSGKALDKARILEPAHLPEAYTPNGEPGIRAWPSQFHLGYAALRLIRAHYAATHPGYRELGRDELVEVVDEAGGNTHMVNDFDRGRHLDLVHVEDRLLFEVVPPGRIHEEAGKKRVDWQLLLLNKAMLGVPEFKLGTGYEGEIGVRFAEGAPAWKLTFATMAPGIVRYEWHVLSVGEATEEAYRDAYLNNRWREPTANETTRFARALHEVVERLVQAREKLGTRAETEMPMLPGNTVADDERSVALWSAHDDRIARLLPIVRPDTRGGTSVPQAVAKRLASCSRRSVARLKPEQYTMNFNVYVTDEGRVVSALVKRSTLGDPAIEACMTGVLRETMWPMQAAAVADASASRTFIAQAQPAEPLSEPGPISEIRPKVRPQVPAVEPRGVRFPLVFTLALGPVVVGAMVFGTITFWSSEAAPAWRSEMNPINGKPYTSAAEYEQVRRLSPPQILAAQRAWATANKPPTTTAPITQAEREQEKKKQQCAKLAKEIDEIINAERKDPPKNGYPQGRKGLKERWRELAENEGNWGYKPDGTLGKNLKGHLDAYRAGQRELKGKLDEWKGCDDKDLPRNAKQYAAQEPEIGPGKPLEPKPVPTWEPAASLAVSVPKGPPRAAHHLSPAGNVPKDGKPSK